MLMISRISYAFPSTLLSRDRAIVCWGGGVVPNQLVPAGGVDLGPGHPFTRCNRIATGPPVPTPGGVRGRPGWSATGPARGPSYATISVTTPEPTVLPPSPIATRSPPSIAIAATSPPPRPPSSPPPPQSPPPPPRPPPRPPPPTHPPLPPTTTTHI